MDADETVNGHYLTVQAARAAIVRASSTPAPTDEASRNTDAANESGGTAGTGLRLVAAKRYGLRAFLATCRSWTVGGSTTTQVRSPPR